MDRHPITITPEIHERACQFLADNIATLATRIGSSGQQVNSLRRELGMQPNPAMSVQEVAAQMALWLARGISSGKLVPETEAHP